MRQTMDSPAIESTILLDFAAFDPSAPINATILFDNDSNEHTDTPFKFEYETEDHTSHITMMQNRLEIPINSREEITETNFDKTIQQNVAKESNTHQIEDLQNEISKTENSRKRKQKQLQIYKNKMAAKTSVQINSSNNVCTKNNLNKEQSEITTPTSEYCMSDSNQCFKIDAQNPQQPKHTAGLPELPVFLQNIMDSQNRTETCLSSVSEYMRHIISAYYYQRQHQTFKEDYKRIKNKLFVLSYNTVVEKLLPEENNTQFIKDFVNATYRRASEKSTYKSFYQDYDMLLAEIMQWAKNKIKKSSEQPNPTGQNNDVQLNNSHKSGDNMENICIFSSGSPDREVRITIDPSLGTCSKKEGMQQSLKEISKSNEIPSEPLPPKLPQIRKPLEMQPPPLQSQFGQPTNIPTLNNLQSSLVPTPNSQLTNLQKKPRPSQRMQQQHREPPPHSEYTNLQQQLGQQYREHGNGRPQQLQHVQIHHGQLQQVQPHLGQSQHAPQQYKQSDHVQSHYGPLHMQQLYSQPAPPQYGHSNDMQRQFVQSQQVPQHYAQSYHLPPQNGQPKIGQSQHVPPPCGPYARPNVGQSQSVWNHYEQSNYNRPQNGNTKPRPPLVRQLQPVRPHYQQPLHLLPQHEQHVQSKYFRPQSGHSQPVLPSYNETDCLKSLLEKPQRMDWHLELNVLYNQGQIQSQNQKSSPRSASTDSGFISPLNFNVSADQTVGTPDYAKAKERAPIWKPPTEQSETTSPLITHVTSLNPEVSFIKQGNCVVCNKSTKQMCMGCMKHYYCTYECQLQDWSSHEPYCKMNNYSNS